MKSQRMINTQITQNDDFLDLPLTSQYLFYRLIENCDNEGFIDNVKMITRTYQCSTKDIDNLVKAKFLLTKDKKVYCIKHWNILQWQRFERLSPSKYDLRNDLYIKANGSYTLNKQEGIRYIVFFEIIKQYIKKEPKEKKVYYYDYVIGILNKYQITKIIINNKQITISNKQITNNNKHLTTKDSQCNVNEEDDDCDNLFDKEDDDYCNPFGD